MDFLGGDLALGMGFDTWGDPFAIPQAPLPGVQPTVLLAAFGLTEFSNMPYFSFNTVGSVGPEGFNSGYIPFFPNNDNSVGVPGDVGTLLFQSSSVLDPVNPLQAWYSTPLSSMPLLPYSPPQSTLTAQPPDPLSEVTIPPTLPLPPIVDMPQAQMIETSNNDSATGVHLKRKHMPSLHAERDNAIGIENQVPILVTGTTSNGTVTTKPKKGQASNVGVTSGPKNK